MTFYAHVVNVRTDAHTARDFATAELAARNLAMLMRRDGWQVGTDDTVTRLVLGETLTHKRFAYSVSDRP